MKAGIIKKACGILCCWLALPALAQSPVQKVLEAYKADKDLKNASYGFCILDAQSGKVIEEHNADMSLVPASTLKIVTTSAALGILGKNYTYKTKIYFSEKPDSVKGVLNGDIIVKGSGDPTLNSDYFYKDNTDAVAAWAAKLRQMGLKQVKGMVITDASCFDNNIPSTWIWGDIGNYFGAGANGLSYCDNKFILTFQSFGAGQKANLLSEKTRIGDAKEWPAIHVQDSVFSGGKDDNAFIFGGPGTESKTVRGTIPANQAAYEVEGALANPPIALRDHFEAMLDKEGIKIMYESTKNWTEAQYTAYKFNYPAYRLAYTHVSPTLDRIVYFTNTKSDNHYAESLLNTIGAAKSGRQGTTDNGIDAAIGYWKGRGVDVSGLFMVDGSGLSRGNAITTRIQATILSKIYRDSLMYPVFNASLPVAGRNGSMTSLCKGTFAENNLRAKTGYITRARGYCGYVKTKSGRELAFSVLFNNYACTPTEMKLKIEKLMVALTEL